MFQSLSEWVSSNPDVPNHIKHLVKVANGVKASGALTLVASYWPGGHEDLTSDSSSSTSESSSS